MENTQSNQNTPIATVLIVSYNSADELYDCLQSVEDQEIQSGAIEVILGDNASADQSVALVREHFPNVIVQENEDNLGFAAANNRAFQQAKGETIFLVNPDSVLEKNAIQQAIRYLDENPTCGIVGGLLLDDDGHRSPSARRFPNAFRKAMMISGLSDKLQKWPVIGDANYEMHDHNHSLEVDWVPGAFTGIRRELIEQIGFFDERFYLYFEETDLCLRAKQYGWEVHFTPEAVVSHTGGASGRKVKHHTFDEEGSQVRPFRLRAECLYHRKNHGLMAVIGTLGFEYAWHIARQVLHLRPGKRSRTKRNSSRLLAKAIREAMIDTSYGSVCPPKPW